MTQLIVLGASAAAVALLVLFAALMGFRGRARVADDAALAAEIARAEPDARITASLIDARGRAGVARLGDGRFAIARALGDKIAVRVYPRLAARAGKGRVTLRFDDAGFPDLHLRHEGAAPDWLGVKEAKS